ncbi:MAG: hypothetical protein ABSD99_04310 [Candidatus Bathyarchaeia archaeon]
MNSTNDTESTTVTSWPEQEDPGTLSVSTSERQKLTRAFAMYRGRSESTASIDQRRVGVWPLA